MITRRNLLKKSMQAALALTLPSSWTIEASDSFDLLIRGGTVLDGTGGTPLQQDIGISGDAIVALESIPKAQAKKVIDASGLMIAPGFIDIHSHSDSSLPVYPTADSRVLQGVTTEITGNCGSSAAPWKDTEESRKSWIDEEGIIPDWKGVASYFDYLERETIALNQAMLLGQGTIRSNVLGEVDRKATSEELALILRAVEEGMDQGAVGVSTGLEYSPGMYTPTDELVHMAKIVARYGGFYASHIRHEGDGLLSAIAEALNIGRSADIRVEISHFKASGRANWSKQQPAIDRIEKGRNEGIDVHADAYPYTAYSTGLTVIFLPWVLDGGTQEMMKRLRDPGQRTRIRKELIAYVSKDPGDYDLIVISSVRGAKNKNTIGKNIVQIAEMWKVEPVDAILRLIEEEEGSVSYVGHGMSPENVDQVLSHPLVMIGSDGSSIAPSGKAGESQPHPRSYGAYPRVLGYYCRERKIFDLPTAIKKMTSMPADQAGIKDRGRIARGKKADLVLFDPQKVKDLATYEMPHKYPEGILHVIINGVQVVENSKHTGARPGRILRRQA